MASNTSSWYSISGHASRKYRAYVNAYIESETETTATIYVEGCVQAYYMSQYGARVRVYVDGSEVGTAAVAIYNSSGEAGNWGWASGTLTVEKSASEKSITCKCLVEGETVNGCGGVNGGSPSASVSLAVSTLTYPPNAPTNVVSTRESDNKNVITWTAPETSEAQPCLYIGVYRQVDGGEWSQVASISGDSTSYNDATTAADHYYAYRVRAWNSAGYSDYATSETTYNTPAAPTRVRAYRTDATTVKIEVANAARTATALEVQRSSDEATWSTVATVSGSPVTETADSPGGGTFYYRVRNTRGSLASDWSSVSNGVVTIVPPAAPTLVSPASGVVVSKAQDAVIFEWAHNPIDGSAQTAAELRYSTDGGSTWKTVAVSGNAASYGLTNAFAVNSTVTWGVRTKGAHADYGPWSGNRAFSVYQEPTVAFEQPAEGFVVGNMPIAIQLQYDDPSGDLVSAALSISDGSKVVWSRTVTGLSYEIAADEWVPENESAYYLTVDARSSSSLTASASREFTTAFVPPIPATVDVEYDVETGFASLATYLWQPLPVTWDGDPTGFDTAFDINTDNSYCKVSDYAPSAEEVIGGQISLVLLDQHLSASITASDIENMADGFLINATIPSYNMDDVFAVSVTGSSMTFPTNSGSTFTLPHGLWFVYSTLFTLYVSSLTGPSSGSTSITWDGDTTGRETSPLSDIHFKVSDATPTISDLVGQTYTLTDTTGSGFGGVYEITADFVAEVTMVEGMSPLRVVVHTDGESTIAFIIPENATVEDVGTFSAGLYLVNDGTGYVSELTLPDGGSVEPDKPESISVYREVNGERVLLGEGLQPGAGLVDKYAPVNVDYGYVVVAIADSGAVNTRYVPARLDSQWLYFIFGDNVAKGRINPSGSKKIGRPNRRQRHFAGRQLPVSFDDGSVSETRSVSVLLRTKDEADAFDRLMRESGRCVYKSADGDVIRADAEVTDKPAWNKATYYGTVTVSLTRVDGRAL